MKKETLLLRVLYLKEGYEMGIAGLKSQWKLCKYCDEKYHTYDNCGICSICGKLIHTKEQCVKKHGAEHKDGRA